ncbi:hypothetical protein BKG85_04795 [Mycobacteroides chelonae]|nr:hypothetical protein [Mycobacteroides chelonae]OHU64933.1 hypothetical protein BKG85_04795 [Mycobacteroides chelonae]
MERTLVRCDPRAGAPILDHATAVEHNGAANLRDTGFCGHGLSLSGHCAHVDGRGIFEYHTVRGGALAQADHESLLFVELSEEGL